MFDISYYTNIIKCDKVQCIIDSYEDVFIFFSLLFFLIGLILLINQKFLIKDAKRRVMDFLSSPTMQKPRKFIAMWQDIQKLINKGDYRIAIQKSNNLLFQILKRMEYSGKDLEDLIEKNQINEKIIPNLDNVKEMIKLEKEKDYQIPNEKAIQVLDLFKDTLIKINILEQ